MVEVSSEFETLYFQKNTSKGETERKKCKIIDTDTNTIAYSFDTDSQIWVYYGNKDREVTEGNPIIDGDQLVKLTVKDRGSDKFMYVDFINTHVVENPPKLEEIINIIKSITTQLNIKKIVLQDDAHFYLNNSENAVKALHLRALQEKYTDKLSIYQNVKFRPNKQDNMKSCVEALTNITCNQMYEASRKILDSLININYSTTSVYQINVQHTNLEVSYIPIKAHKLRLGPIFNRYRENLQQLNKLLEEVQNNHKKIYEFCKIIQKGSEREKPSTEKDYERSHNFFSCLENDVNMNVIIVESEGKREDFSENVCDVNKTVETVTKNPINITKIFNLFYGTFKKLDYLYNEMVCDVISE